MMAPSQTRVCRPLLSDRRTMIRHLAATLCGIAALLYLVLFFLVKDAESGAPENTYGAYLFLAVPYLIGAALMVIMDRRELWIVGAAAQVVVIVLFVMFGAGALGPGQGVFDYAALSGLHMDLWAVLITGVEACLLGLLIYLALTWQRVPHDDSRRPLPR